MSKDEKPSESSEGYIVHPLYQTRGSRTRIFLVGRLRNGETFAVVEERAEPGLYVRVSDRSEAERIASPAEVDTSAYRTVDGEATIKLIWGSIQPQQQAAQSLAAGGIRTYEADIRFYDQYFLDRHILGPVIISGSYSQGTRVDRVYRNPDVAPSSWIPRLSLLSVDIETNPATSEILSISLAGDDPGRDRQTEEVLFAGPATGQPFVTGFTDERGLLLAFQQRILALDPDIITGWNVIEFDFMVIAQRFQHHAIPFVIGRSDQPAEYLAGGRGQSGAAVVPGRQVIDAMRIMRASPMRFEDNRLETVAQAILGEGKVEVDEGSAHLSGRRKIEALLRTYRENPESFCEYSMQDARLVIDILHSTGMMDLTVRRALLTGVGLARAWTSVAAFEHLYIDMLHRRGIVAPTHGVDTHPVEGAPGGAIIPPEPGFYDNVLVYDFQSLYPSIMRTFNIDPLSFVSPRNRIESVDMRDLIEAPNGALFGREEAILPELLERFFENRQKAKAENDPIASYVYKIIMNSFYGVLGTPGCRFASSDIAGAITSFGHQFLRWCRSTIEEMGYHVIYGDTDSLFVLSGRKRSEPPDSILELAGEITEQVGARLAEYVCRQWEVRSYLRLEFQTLYVRFYLPSIRGMGAGGGRNGVDREPMKGRAKGYAGLRYTGRSQEPTEFDVKGMEAVRRDWTDAAKTLQVHVLEMLFNDRPKSEITAYIRDSARKLRAGELDASLVYRKALRKPVSAYTRSVPPHVRAAMDLDPADRHGLIEYVWTVDGPQPIEKRTAPIDYEHYLEKQLKPLVTSIGAVIGEKWDSLFESVIQTDLF